MSSVGSCCSRIGEDSHMDRLPVLEDFARFREGKETAGRVSSTGGSGF